MESSNIYSTVGKQKNLPLPKIHSALLRWYKKHQRNFPWRNTRIPYRILLSEIMLQQTQASRVIEYYKRWLKIFPTLSVLAHASVGDVLRMWSGLGYNSRALRLHRLATIVVKKYSSRLPRITEELEALPGIGKYTSHAVVCFAYEQNVAVVDVNIRRILTRLSIQVQSTQEMLNEKKSWRAAEKYLHPKKAYHWNQALMDLGSQICTARNPRCGECPLSSFCVSSFSKVFLKKESQRKKVEPERRGIPRRLYRGKILKLLHHHSFSMETIASILWNDFSAMDSEWLIGVLNKMEHDGLIRLTKNKYKIVS